MVQWKRRSLQGFGFVCLLVVIYAGLRGDDPEAVTVLVAGGAVLGAAAMAVAVHLDGVDEYDERQLLIRYRSGYLAFMATFWYLFALVIVSIDDEVSANRVPLTADGVVQLGFAFAAVVFFGSLLYYRRRF